MRRSRELHKGTLLLLSVVVPDVDVDVDVTGCTGLQGGKSVNNFGLRI